jgi:hypothetical protein
MYKLAATFSNRTDNYDGQEYNKTKYMTIKQDELDFLLLRAADKETLFKVDSFHFHLTREGVFDIKPNSVLFETIKDEKFEHLRKNGYSRYNIPLSDRTLDVLHDMAFINKLKTHLYDHVIASRQSRFLPIDNNNTSIFISFTKEFDIIVEYVISSIELTCVSISKDNADVILYYIDNDNKINKISVNNKTNIIFGGFLKDAKAKK